VSAAPTITDGITIVRRSIMSSAADCGGFFFGISLMMSANMSRSIIQSFDAIAEEAQAMR